MKPNDVMIFDRGLKDCLELLDEMGLVHEMPKFLNKQQHFLTEDADETHLVTKVRQFNTKVLYSLILDKNIVKQHHTMVFLI